MDKRKDVLLIEQTRYLIHYRLFRDLLSLIIVHLFLGTVFRKMHKPKDVLLIEQTRDVINYSLFRTRLLFDYFASVSWYIFLQSQQTKICVANRTNQIRHSLLTI
jgi:hypothetical protein